MGEGRGEGENTAISTSYVPLPFIPSHQGRGNPTFYECINYMPAVIFFACPVCRADGTGRLDLERKPS